MKKICLLLQVTIIAFVCFACVDYKTEVSKLQQTEQEKIELQKMMIGDVNRDGIKEYLLVEGSRFKIMSEKKCDFEFEPIKSVGYSYVNVLVNDIDEDETNEIVILAVVYDAQRVDRLFSVFMLDQNSEGQYYLRVLPTELKNIAATSGIDADIIPKDNYIYEVKCLNRVFKIDVSRVYGLSFLSEYEKEKVEKEWNSFIEKKRTGEVIGISDIEIVTNENGSKNLRICELVVGADEKNIGFIVVEVDFASDGSYSVVDVEYLERVDIQP